MPRPLSHGPFTGAMSGPVRTALGILVVAAAVGGCGGGGEQTRTVVVTAPAAPAALTAAPTAPSKPVASPRRWKQCDANIRARRGSTSCAFAENVFYGFWQAQAAGDDRFSAYSPVTAREYEVTCTVGNVVACRAGDGASVRFARAAVDAYTAEAAFAYCSTHDLGAGAATCDAAPADAAAVEPQSDGPTGGECDSSYEGACLDPSASDYDCEGGSGDGPQYTGPVTVVGDDHFGLDRDGDGLACE